MTNWKHTIDGINRMVGDSEIGSGKETGRKVHDMIKSLTYLKGFDTSRFLSVTNDQEFNQVWEDFYDFCDEHRIWLGL